MLIYHYIVTLFSHDTTLECCFGEISKESRGCKIEDPKMSSRGNAVGVYRVTLTGVLYSMESGLMFIRVYIRIRSYPDVINFCQRATLFSSKYITEWKLNIGKLRPSLFII